MKWCISTALMVVLLAVAAFMVAVSHGETQGTVENITFATDSGESVDLAENIANLIIAHGLEKSFSDVFINANEEDDNIPPILILKLSAKGEFLPLKGNKELDELLDEATFMMADHFRDEKVEVWVQNNQAANLLKVAYDPAENKVTKKIMEPE